MCIYIYLAISSRGPSSSPDRIDPLSPPAPFNRFFPSFFLTVPVLETTSTKPNVANEIPSSSTSSRRRCSSLRRSFLTPFDGREFKFDQVNSCNSCLRVVRTLLMRSFFFEGQVLIIGDFDTSSSSSSFFFFFVLSIEATSPLHTLHTPSLPFPSKAIFATTIIDDKYARTG